MEIALRPSALRLAFTLALVAVTCTAAAAADAQPPRSATSTPPLVRGHVRVAVGIYVVNLARVDETQETYEMELYQSATWHDPRLAHHPGTLETRAPGSLWTPMLAAANAVKPAELFQESIRVDSSGLVTDTRLYNLTASATPLMRSYPFDQERLDLVIQPFLSQARQIVLVQDAAATGVTAQSYASLSQWRLARVDAQIAQANLPGVTLRQLTFHVHVARESEAYLWEIFMPLLLMVVVASTAFWVPIADLGSQLLITVTTLLTIIAFSLSIADAMPKVPYVTYLEAFFLLCYGYTFIVALAVIAFHVLSTRKNAALAERIRAINRWALPVAFVGCNIAILSLRFTNPIA